MKESAAWLFVIGVCVLAAARATAGEVLYNGIVLPDVWPPKYDRPPNEPMPVPYLASPPAVIPIDVGRQLFVDDFLVQETTLKRSFHRVEYCKENPIVRPDQPWENKGRGLFAAPFSGGAWFDPQDKLFKMWYCGGYLATVCYATSSDGIRWEKPKLDFQTGTNVLFVPGLDPAKPRHDTTLVWLDADAKDPKERFKYFATESGKGWELVMRVSADGLRWSDPVAAQRIGGDRTTVFYNPFRKVWVISERINWGGRARAYTEDPDPRAAVAKLPKARVNWVSGEKEDPRNPNKQWSGLAPQLYNLDATPYESLMLGLFVIWQGPNNGDCGRLSIQKRNEVLLGYSRDGFHWSRPDRTRFLEVNETEGAWNMGNVQSVGGGCLVVGDRLFFYFSGRAKPKGQWDADAATGLAFLRRDGFASMDADDKGGTLTTRPVTFKGKHLFVNLACPKGELRVEVLAEDGKPIAPFAADNCIVGGASLPVSGASVPVGGASVPRVLSSSSRGTEPPPTTKPLDSTCLPIRWQGAEDLSALSGKPVRFRFHLKTGALYAFWVSPDPSGASHGYTAAGGPGLPGPIDTTGGAR
ncbi:MAG TPA: hypothetical protein VNE39_27035 [Planctomycetota bacterium]|nr:hypothetical protein [Planctomycetota bacterium]